MKLSENAKELYKLRLFGYRGQQCAVAEVDLSKSHFTGCCQVLHGVLCCVINTNLSEREKQNTLHKLIKKRN
ncbi:hypothetical protein [Clostridium neonatale]|uniref:Uncharacterized protein n=1 Tax=Clostridium neonatale TaxID=137838 RepID=A0AA86JTX8_9CLOT|nr:conserved hypothetical protein [Clostridium neonatale]